MVSASTGGPVRSDVGARGGHVDGGPESGARRVQHPSEVSDRVVVLGVGNVLTGDDALGPTVVRTLDAGWILDPRVDVMDAGTPGMDLTVLVGGAEGLVVVDTVLSEGPPGTLKTYDREALLARPLTPRVNPHAPGLVESLLTMELADRAPRRVCLVGVVPHATHVGVGLSPAAADAVSHAVEAVVEILSLWGLSSRRRESALPPDLWWERASRGGFLEGSARTRSGRH